MTAHDSSTHPVSCADTRPGLFFPQIASAFDDRFLPPPHSPTLSDEIGTAPSVWARAFLASTTTMTDGGCFDSPHSLPAVQTGPATAHRPFAQARTVRRRRAHPRSPASSSARSLVATELMEPDQWLMEAGTSAWAPLPCSPPRRCAAPRPCLPKLRLMVKARAASALPARVARAARPARAKRRPRRRRPVTTPPV